MARAAGRVDNIEWGAASYPLPGQAESGDMYVIHRHSNGVLVGVVDGLGHGGEAAFAAEKAVSTLALRSDESVISLVQRCHEVLMATRGVVMSLASFYFPDDTMTWIGVGNVEGILARTNSEHSPSLTHIFHRQGVVGYQLPQLQASVMQISRGDVLILATDGIRPEFSGDMKLRGTPEQIASDIGERFRRENDDALVLVARYL